MKNRLILIGLIILISSCNLAQRDDRVSEDITDKSEIDKESSVVYESSDAIWKYGFNQQTEEFEVTKLRPVDKQTLTGEKLENIINKNWPGVQIKFIGTSNDTAFISIPESEVLTQRMGSAGAESFMVSTTYSFTELIGINHVSFGFEEGDHAIPGAYHRNSWDVKIIE